MKIYTKTGDKGTTGLFGGGRVSKSHVRIDAYGTIDELNSYMGLLRDQEINAGRQGILIEIQEYLFTIGSMLATEDESKSAGIPTIDSRAIETLEKAIDTMEETLEPMRNFILPGGHASVSFCHVARCVCRRSERRVVKLSETETIDPLIIHYLNRLSDYLFVLSRKMSAELGVKETPWKPRG